MPLMIIDDSNFSVVYAGQWITGGTDQEHNHTVHGSWTKDSNATISFTGRSIQVYGTIGRDHNNGDPAFAPITTYMIDKQNDSTSTFTGKPDTDILYKQLFYQSPKLSNGQHELVITLTTSNMNTMWIDYFQIEASAPSAPKFSSGVIAGAVVGGIFGITLLVTIGILWRRRQISCLKRRSVQYEKLSWNAPHWPWTSTPGKLTPFGSDPFPDTRPLNGTIRPFSVEYTRYSLESWKPPELSNENSLSGYTIRGDTAADKTTRRESTSTGYTSLSGYTTQGGTSAEKTMSSTTSNASQIPSSRSNTAGNTSSIPRQTKKGTPQATDNRSSRPTNRVNAVNNSRRKDPPSSTNASFDVSPRPFTGVTTSRVVIEGEEVPPAYSTNIQLNFS